MISNKKNVFLFKSFYFFYAAFLFLLPVIGGLGKVNNLFHIALMLCLIIILFNEEIRGKVFNNRDFNTGLFVLAIFLSYFSLSTLWGAEERGISSELTHSFYLIMFVIFFNLVAMQGKKNTMLAMFFSGALVLLLLTLYYVDKHILFENRLGSGFSLAPENVIDMGGYYGIGIFCGLILIRETGHKWLYLPVAFLLVGLLLTQSRGPLLALVIACVPLLLFKRIHLSHLLIIGLIIAVIVSVIVFANANELLVRIERSYSQSFTRFGIWENALHYVQQKPWFGWGFDKQLDFVNVVGQRVHTTHSLYFATLLKGGIIGGVLLLSVITYGLYMGWQQIKAGHALETSMFLFSLIFYSTQGMFIISNPSVSWVIFWLPLAVVMALPKRQEK
ncbi:O-antigen ligase [Erwinia toletana]|uniref:O-antigen ligase n=1 Tax=Winslowiella toletana TaxID=92490 RepID=A0ABS4P909_9GAMM|nr:O-antigen ligase family protein [Winslowiella toletana]MBP2169118.1 O-antigen ligase [Winslowiella toletana]